jgi:anti-anti-sigma regulatory factor
VVVTGATGDRPALRAPVDLRGVHQLSGPAVASVLSAHRTCRARGGTVVLRGANRRTLDLLHRTGSWRVLELESNLIRARGHLTLQGADLVRHAPEAAAHR